MKFRAPLAGFAAALALTIVIHGQDAGPSALGPQPAVDGVRLLPTVHATLPATLAHYWLVPEIANRPVTTPPAGEGAKQRFARGVALINKGEYAAGLPLVRNADLAGTTLAGYAQFYAAVALVGLSRPDEADALLSRVPSDRRLGFLAQGVPVRQADIALARGDAGRAVSALREIADERILNPEAVLLQLAIASERAGDLALALQTHRKIYYELPLSVQATDAQAAIARLEGVNRDASESLALEKARAEALFNARRWAQAKASYEALARMASGDTDAVVAIRIAACDYHLNRFRAAREALTSYVADQSQAEARFFHLSATRELGDHATYVRLARKLVEDHPRSSWAEETLNNLATHYITVDDDAAADLVLRQMLASFPRGRYADRASWRIGWRAYRAGEFREAAEVFERAAQAFPRADYRPAWLYWSGQARLKLDERPLAARRLALVVADYQNSYYGRLADKILSTLPDSVLPARIDPTPPAVTATNPIPTDPLIRELIALELYDDALREVQFAQRKWGDSPQLQATSAFIRHNQGFALKAEERFTAVRGAITTMRRAYPQFMAAGGERLPDEVLRIIFPLDYWPLITKYSTVHKLDPYLVAALMAQESTFTAEIRSSANAYGLMQLIPATGRRYARKLGIRNFTTNSLKNPETNVRLGTEYFKDLLTQFGGAHYALAGYNAGENRVEAWIEERGPLPADEFVDDIPFPETQNYVKRILGTADDYRRLYGPGRLDPKTTLVVARPAPTTAPAATRKPAAPASTTKKPTSTPTKSSSSTSRSTR
jgi:soluble lytic murein transglycosylase